MTYNLIKTLFSILTPYHKINDFNFTARSDLSYMFLKLESIILKKIDLKLPLNPRYLGFHIQQRTPHQSSITNSPSFPKPRLLIENCASGPESPFFNIWDCNVKPMLVITRWCIGWKKPYYYALLFIQSPQSHCLGIFKSSSVYALVLCLRLVHSFVFATMAAHDILPVITMHLQRKRLLNKE